MNVLALGANGSTAGMVVPALVNRGIEVRGLVRAEDKRESVQRASAIETVLADLAALTAAAEGADGMFGIIPVFAADEAQPGVNIVKAAAAGGVEKVMLSSIYHPTLALANHVNKQPAERALYESNLDFTILQPANFMARLHGLWQTLQTRAGSFIPI